MRSSTPVSQKPLTRRSTLSTGRRRCIAFGSGGTRKKCGPILPLFFAVLLAQACLVARSDDLSCGRSHLLAAVAPPTAAATTAAASLSHPWLLDNAPDEFSAGELAVDSINRAGIRKLKSLRAHRHQDTRVAFALPDEAIRSRSRICCWRPCRQGGSAANIVRDLKMAVAGALAGAVATAALFPIDTAKTLRQANPQAFQGTRAALGHICQTRGPWAIYTGLPTAVIGAMPSSALYFGTYEAVKSRLLSAAAKAFPGCGGVSGGGGTGEGKGGGEVHPAARAGAHAIAAACGNAASSLIFVPKEYVKQTLQASGMHAAGGARETAKEIIQRTVREKGVQGLYCGYWATLSRNIPSAVIRFSLYEEIKLFLGPARLMSAPPAFLLAGALAGACASGLTTPFDVLKTRVATGSLDGGKGFATNMASIVSEHGWKGLYAGFQPRVVMSALFTAVGFGSFETIKGMLGVSPLPPQKQSSSPAQAMPRSSSRADAGGSQIMRERSGSTAAKASAMVVLDPMIVLEGGLGLREVGTSSEVLTSRRRIRHTWHHGIV